MFRDEGVARHERELAELRDKLEAERERAERAEEAARRAGAAETAARSRAEMAEAERKLRGGWFKQWLDRRAERKRERLSWVGPSSLGYGWGTAGRRHIALPHVMMGFAFLAVVGLIALNIYHYCTDIQEGVVTGRDYHPPHTSCSTDSHGHTSCTTYPESWTVDIAFEGQSATWTVSHSEYERTAYGDWFCYTDVFHSHDNCHGRPGGPE